jgi:NADH-quinone oxidoreductase subunit N
MNYTELFRATLPETVLEVAALVVLLVDLGILRKAGAQVRLAVSVLLGVIGCAVALQFLIAQDGAGYVVGGLTVLSQNGPGVILQAGILVLTALTLLLLFGTKFTRHVGEYVAVILFAASGGLLVAVAQDLIVIFIGLELLSLGLYILTAFAKHSEKSAEAALKYYLFGGMSAAFLLFGFSYLYGLSGSTNLVVIQSTIAQQGATPLLFVAWILVVAGLGFKVAAVPFHLWAPDAYEGAPAPAAAFIASVSKVASFALLLIFSLGLLIPSGAISGHQFVLEPYFKSVYQTWQPLGNILLVVAAASMLIGNLAALAQTSARRLLAYSAIAHAGYMLLGIATHAQYTGQCSAFAFMVNATHATGLAANAVIIYVLTYALTTIGAFGVVGIVEQETGSDRIEAFSGLHKRNPLLAGILLVLFLSLAGIPPLIGFWAKFNLFSAVLGTNAGLVPFILVALAIALSAVSLYYYLRVLKFAYVVEPNEGTGRIKAHPVVMLVLLAIAATVILLGVFPNSLMMR